MARLLTPVSNASSNGSPGAPQSLSQKIWGGVSGVAKAVEQPFVSLAAAPVQGLAKALGQPDPYANSALGGINVSPLTLKQKAGDALKAGAEIGTVAAAPVSIPGLIGTGAALGAAQSGGDALQKDASLGDATKQAAIGGAIGGATGGALGLAGKALKGVGEAVYKAIIPKSMREAGLLQAYQANVPFLDRVKAAATGEASKAPTLAGDTAFSQGLAGTESMLGVQAKRASSNIWNTIIAPKLEQSSQRVDMPTFFNEIESTIKKETPELSRQGALLEALDALKQDYATKPVASLTDLQNFKEGWAQFIPDKAYQGKPIAGAFKDVTAQAADLARQTIYKALGPEAKQAYFDYGNLKAIQELGQKAMSGGKLKGGFGGFWSAVKDMALTPVLTVGGQTVYKAGQGLELTGKKGAAVLSDILTPKTAEYLLSSPQPTGDQAQQLHRSSSKPSTSLDAKRADVAATGLDTIDRMSKGFGGGGVGAIEKGFAGAALSRIHPEDVAVITKFIDGVRLNKQLPLSVERGAQALAEHWGLNVQKSAKSLADEFENVLSGAKKVKSTNLGKFTPK